MQIKLATRHGHLNESHQDQIRAKAEKLLHYFDRITQIEVTIDLKNDLRKEVEFLVKLEHKHDLVAREGHEELMAAVDLALDKISHQVRRHKEKLQDHRRDRVTGRRIENPPAEEPEEA